MYAQRKVQVAMAMLPIALGIARLPADNPYVGTMHHGKTSATAPPPSCVLSEQRNNPHAPYMRHAPPRTESSSSLKDWEMVDDGACHASYVHVED